MTIELPIVPLDYGGIKDNFCKKCGNACTLQPSPEKEVLPSIQNSMLDEIYTLAIKLSRSNTPVGEKRDFYITLEQLSNILKAYDEKQILKYYENNKI